MTANDDLVQLSHPRPEITQITLNRPERLNALSWDLVDTLHATFDAIHADNTCRLVILTGAGRGFCSGLDLTDAKPPTRTAGTRGPRAGMLMQEHIAELMLKITRIQQPVIAAVNGVAYGGGFALALASDLRVASPTATFCTQFIKLGLSGCDVGVSYFLPKLIGGSKAHELLLTARKLPAEEADRLGLLAAVDEDPVAKALELADTVLAHSPFGVVMTKEVMWANLDAPSLAGAMALENRTQILTTTGGDFAEATAAFIEKRPPNWT